jgi:hypothetical protein
MNFMNRREIALLARRAIQPGFNRRKAGLGE